MTTDEQLIARARVIAAELNKTLLEIAARDITIDYRVYQVRQRPGYAGEIDGIRFELEFARVTKVTL